MIKNQLTPCEILVPLRPYNAGEIAGFGGAELERLLRAKQVRVLPTTIEREEPPIPAIAPAESVVAPVESAPATERERKRARK